jgi:hypothetical protein
MVYTVRDLIEDCATKKSRTDLPIKEKRKVFQAIWQALNDWIDLQFSKGLVRAATARRRARAAALA